MAINYEQFIKKHIGKGVDYDGACGVQCVDLAKCYLNEVFGIKAGAWGDAHSGRISYSYDNITAEHLKIDKEFITELWNRRTDNDKRR